MNKSIYENYDEEEQKRIFAENLTYWLDRTHKSQADIAVQLGISEAAVHFWVKGKKLPRMGKIQHIADFLGINVSDLVYPRDPGNASAVTQHLFNIPVYESVSAGFGANASDSIVDYTPIPFHNKHEASECLCIRVTGDSMSPRIENNDLILVQKQSSVDSGDVAVVLIDGEQGFVKKVEYDTEYIKLVSFNPYYPPIEFHGAEVTRVMVVGKVKRIIRDF